MLREKRLESWAYVRLPGTHPLRAQCLQSFAKWRFRHELIKREVVHLVREWNAAGIVPVIYKGFALAEFVYKVPGTRFHADVDVLVQPSEFERALQIGRAQGRETPSGFEHWAWRMDNPHERTLKKVGGATEIDLHQRLVMTVLPWTGREHELTQRAYEASTETQWQGLRIRQLSLEDSFIFGLVISRCWGGDNWTLKAHDYLDACALVEQGLTREQLLRRASDLNVARTVTNFLKRCDPFAQSLDLRPPNLPHVIALEAQSVTEHVPLMLGVFLLRLLRMVLAVWHLPRILPLYWETRRVLASEPDVSAALSRLERSPQRWGRNRVDVLFYWWWAKRSGRAEHLTWPVMAYIALRRRGEKPLFRLGTRTGIQRGWVELNGQALPEFYYELHWTRTYKVTFERS